MQVVCPDNAKNQRAAAFSLIEGIIAMAIVGIAFVALYSGLTYGFARVKFSRENHRATQILIEKMETIRLYNWSQINSNGYIPKTFEVSYYPNATGSNAGVLYEGTLEIDDSDLDENYKDNIKRVTVTLEWTSGKTKRTRTLKTYVSQFGLHKSIY